MTFKDLKEYKGYKEYLNTLADDVEASNYYVCTALEAIYEADARIRKGEALEKLMGTIEKKES